jgi:RHS repeat-associated protein
MKGGYTATYAYRYGSKLYSVASNFPSEGNVTYNYGGDQKRRSRTAGGSTTRYNWDIGWTVLNEEDGNGTLTRTFVGRSLADVSGSDPVTGTWRYYFHDNLDSTRRLRDANKSSLGQYEYTPYGLVYGESGVSQIPRKYTGHDPDLTSMLYYAPFRYYNPVAARWMTRDPLGMVDGVNVYGYVGHGLVSAAHPLGLYLCFRESTSGYSPCLWLHLFTDQTWRDDCGNKWCCIPERADPCEKCFIKHQKAVAACVARSPESRNASMDKAIVILTGCIQTHRKH